MGLWNRHRGRQAGKYAKRSYQLEEGQVREASRQQWQAYHRAVEVQRQTRELEASVPQRPDLTL